jgi:crossover junction endodeoxyribonuclease RuvC
VKTPGIRSARIFRVLGLDPAVAGATGYGVVEGDGRSFRMLRYGAVRPAANSRSAASAHLCRVHALVKELIEEFAPTGIAMESVFTALNRGTALRLAEMRGVVLLAAAQNGLEVYSYSPREIKCSVTGYGNAGKEQVQHMIRALLHLPETPEPPDAADALAVALCHILVAQAQRQMAGGFARGAAGARHREAGSRIPFST